MKPCSHCPFISAYPPGNMKSIRQILEKNMNMNRRQWLMLLASGAFTLAAGAQSPPRPPVIYLSRSGNTRAIGEIIAAATGGALFALEPQPPYPRAYQAQVAAAAQELANGSGHPLAALPELDDQPLIYLGWPTWAMQLPPPLQSFLEQADLAGKTIAPFNSHGGYGVGDGFKTLARLAPQSRILPGFSVEGGREKEGLLLALKGERREAVAAQVRQWLHKLNF